MITLLAQAWQCRGIGHQIEMASDGVGGRQLLERRQLLIADGTQLGDIIHHLTAQDFSYSEAHEFVRQCGVEFFVQRSVDAHGDISPERKRELQDLSLT